MDGNVAVEERDRQLHHGARGGRRLGEDQRHVHAGYVRHVQSRVRAGQGGRHRLLRRHAARGARGGVERESGAKRHLRQRRAGLLDGQPLQEEQRAPARRGYGRVHARGGQLRRRHAHEPGRAHQLLRGTGDVPALRLGQGKLRRSRKRTASGTSASSPKSGTPTARPKSST